MYYVNGPGHGYEHHFPSYGWRRPQFPAVDTTLFNQSANETKKLMDDADIIISKLSEPNEFSTEVMQAAQMSEYDTVKQLMLSTGIASDVDVTFNPDGLHLRFTSQIDQKDCCTLNIGLRWR